MQRCFVAAMLAVAVLTAAAALPQEEAMKKNELHRDPIRPAAVAGAFYPADADALTGQIRGFLKAVPSRSLSGSIQAIIVPHAGYVYSGQVAAHAYKLLQGIQYDTVIVIAPSHRYSFRGAAVYPKGAYQIPLGLVPVDTDLAQKLMQESTLITAIPEAHAREHALEVQLPFLKTVLGDFTLLPLVIGACDYAACESIAEALFRSVKNKHVLIVASSDLSHYHPYQTAVTLDQTVINYVNGLDPKGLYQAINSDTCEACGALPIIISMLCAQRLGATRTEQLYYATSGDVSGGDKSAVVGYLAAAFIVPSGPSGARRAVGVDLGLTDEEKKVLHTIAATAIEAGCTGERIPSLPPLSETLREKRGAFVTLHKGNNLRGCIGYIRAQKPLYQTIQEMAQAAAFQDNRFRPVTKDELKDITIELSVLTPLKKINRIEDIAVGTHGIYIVKNVHSGLLLPQVATENKWDRETFLRHTCTKAGLPEDAWRESDAEIYIFSADIF
jgi:hypothetical protein